MAFDVIQGSSQRIADALNNAVVLDQLALDGAPVGGLTVEFSTPLVTVTFSGSPGAMRSLPEIATQLMADVTGLIAEIRVGTNSASISIWHETGFTIEPTGTANEIFGLDTTDPTVSEGVVDVTRIRGFSQGATEGYYSLILSDEPGSADPGIGDVDGPAVATANAIARYNGTTGKIIKNSGVTIDDSGNIGMMPGATVDGLDLSAVINVPVANITALSATPNSVEGATIYVLSVRDYFVSTNRSSPTAADGITVATHASGGNWRWERGNVRHPSWALQTDWFIDPAAGNDEATGLTGAAIKTWGELIRRLGVQHVVKVLTTITIMGNLPAADPMIGEWRVVNGGRVNVTGSATQVFTDTISARQSLNTASNLECQVTSSWTVATHLNRLVINTTRSLSSWVAKDLTGGNARMAPWMLYNETTGSVGPANGNSEVGDTIVVYTLPTVACMQFEIRGTAGSTSPCVFSRLDFTASGGTQRFFAANAQPQFVNCRISGNTRFGAGMTIFTNCWFGADGGYAIDYAAYLRICGGLMTVSWPSSISRPGGNTFELRNSVLFQGAILNSTMNCTVNIQAADFRDITGNPINIQHGSFLAINGPVTGAANTGISIVLAPTSRGTYVPSSLVIASAGGDTQIGGTTRTFASLPYFEANNGACLVAA